MDLNECYEEKVCNEGSICKNTLGSYFCEKIKCQENCKDIHAECIMGQCKCVTGTLDTSYFVKAKHHKLTDKCLIEINDQVSWMNWFFRRFGKIHDDPRFIVGSDQPCPLKYKAELQSCGFKKCVLE